MKRTEEDWRELIGAYRRSGKSLKAFCNEAEITMSNMKYWMYKRSLANGAKRPKAKAPPFISVTLPEIPKKTGIRLEIGDVAIALEKGFDKALLLEVVEALAG